MTMRQTILLSLLALLAQAPAGAAQETGALPHLGTVFLSAGQGKVTLSEGSPARAGAAVTVLLPDPAGGAVTILSGSLGAALDPAEGDARPAFALDLQAADVAGVGFAIIGPLPALEIGDGTIRADMDGDGRADMLSLCLTSEGVALRVTPEGSDDALWEDQFALGYDVDPTCP